MSAETNKAMLRHLNEELNARRLDVLDAHPSMVPMKSFFEQLFAAFPQALAAQTEGVLIPHEARALLAEAQAQFTASGAAWDRAKAKYVAATWPVRAEKGVRA